MRLNSGGKLWRIVPRLTLSVALGGISMAPAADAYPSNAIVLVRPIDLPTLARQSGEAMFLHDTNDGRTFLYVEQREGSQLAIFDVTDPAHVMGKGSAQLDAAGPFDFVADLGGHAELVRFRGDQGDAVLNLGKTPLLKRIAALDAKSSTFLLPNDGSRVNRPVITATVGRDYRVFQTGSSPSDERVVEVREVRQEATNVNTGTTFLLAENGLYLIRRPALETAPEPWPKSGG